MKRQTYCELDSFMHKMSRNRRQNLNLTPHRRCDHCSKLITPRRLYRSTANRPVRFCSKLCQTKEQQRK